MVTLVDNNIYRHSHSPHFRKHVYPLLFSVYLSRLNLVRLLFLSSRICTNEYVRLSMCVCGCVGRQSVAAFVAAAHTARCDPINRPQS